MNFGRLIVDLFAALGMVETLAIVLGLVVLSRWEREDREER